MRRSLKPIAFIAFVSILFPIAACKKKPIPAPDVEAESTEILVPKAQTATKPKKTQVENRAQYPRRLLAIGISNYAIANPIRFGRVDGQPGRTARCSGGLQFSRDAVEDSQRSNVYRRRSAPDQALAAGEALARQVGRKRRHRTIPRHVPQTGSLGHCLRRPRRREKWPGLSRPALRRPGRRLHAHSGEGSLRQDPSLVRSKSSSFSTFAGSNPATTRNARPQRP